MIECVKIERAAATWRIDENIISMPYRRSVGVDKTKSIIKDYITVLKSGEYKSDNYILCYTFDTIGGIPFVKSDISLIRKALF